MSINKSVNEAHHHNSKLKASQEHMGDPVMQKMVSPWKYSSMPSRKKSTDCTTGDTRCNKRE